MTLLSFRVLLLTMASGRHYFCFFSMADRDGATPIQSVRNTVSMSQTIVFVLPMAEPGRTNRRAHPG